MPAAWTPFVLAPPVAFAALVYAVRPHPGVVAPRRLAAVWAALAVGAYAVVSVEVLGALHALTAPAVAAAWTVGLAAALGLAWRRRGPVTVERPSWSRPEWLLAGGVGGLVFVELVIALLAEPNNFDSQTYHLPKVEHWAAQGDLDFWPTAIHRQVDIPPGAEYLLLHLRLLTGGDGLHNLVQWAAGVGCLLVASRIAAQLGGSRRAQLITAFLAGTTPMVALQATSTQTDLVVAAWCGCVATLALDGLSRRATPGAVLALGAATGLTALTKTSGLIGAGPMLVLWGVVQLRLSVLKAVAAGLGVIAVAAAIVAPFMLRVHSEFGHPLGPPRLRDSIPMQRHDPGSILINGLRIGHTALDTPLSPLRTASADAITGFADLIGVDPQDRATTFGRTEFPVRAWYPDEDRVAFPIAGTLVLIGGVAALARPRRGAVRAYATACATTVILHSAMIKWQPWGNRLLMYALILGIPLAGLWLDAVLARARRRTAFVTVAVVLVASALAGVLAVSYGFPRRLVGTGSLLTTDSWDTRFLRRPAWADEFRWAADRVEAAGAQRVGLVQQNDNWEYPWWLLLKDREVVALQSVLPKQPPADPRSVDAIVCTGDRRACDRLVPDGWRLEWRGYVGYAEPVTASAG
jgi:4-amino-4-deoxy-L-arabinose transferase-like glycosyltransferase